MTAWKVAVTPEAQAQIRGMPPAAKKELRAALTALEQGGPEHEAVRRLSTAPDRVLYRMRVRDWRVAFRPEGRRLVVIRVFHRSDGYGWMERLP